MSNEQTLTDTGRSAGVMPVWTAADFSTEAPYKWLYTQHLSRFELRRALNALIDRGVALGVRRLVIQQYWNDYLADQKPAVVVGSNFVTEFPEQEKVLGQDRSMACGKYLCDVNGVSYVGPQGEWVQVIAHPVMPVKRIVDVETNTENLKIAYCRVMRHRDAVRALWKEMITPRITLASAQRIISLSEHGIAVNSENAKEVVKFLSDIETLNYSEMDTQLSCSHMGWLPDGQFAPFTDEVVFGGESDEFNRLYGGFRQEGSEEVWLDIVKGVRNGKSVPARIALAASFAAPLVQKLGALSFFVHFWGLQGSGKTVALLLGASVWGNPQIGGYIKSFSGTKVSQELFAAFCGNLPVFLDELQVISDRKSFDDIIYALCEGVSKGRGAKDGGLQTARRWATVFLTTGEMPIVQSNSGGGAAVRTIEVNYGGEPFFEDARTVANTLKLNYGFAGRRFIEALRKPETMEAVQKAQKEFYSLLSGDIQDKQVLSASLLLTADKLAEEVIFRDGKALTVEEIRPYLITQEQADVNKRTYQFLAEWAASHQGYFSDDPAVNHGTPYGIFEKDSNDGSEWVCFIRSKLDDAIREGGFPSASAFLSWAKRNKLIKTNRYDNYTSQRKVCGRRVSCVVMKIPDDYTDVSDDTELPF